MVDPDGNSARWFTPMHNGNYTVVITNAINNITIPFAVSGLDESKQNVTHNSDDNLTKAIHLSPLKQFKSGIKAEDVKCSSDFILVINRNYSPACVKESSGIELLLRGWAIGFPHYEAMYFMKSNTTAHVFVNYFPNHHEGSNPPDLLIHLYSRIYKLNSSFPTNEINVTAMPDLIHTNSNTVVDYTVTAPDTKGVYWLSLSN
ncbi:MAG: hypothetical protein KGI28_10285, partial [Thaumarchaeota archaeon]|nr:hypothetical protein [Nitrososphaerota archaeon]